MDAPAISSSTTTSKVANFDLSGTMKELKKYLPAQAPLKDFIFQNSLECFQNYPFFDGISKASEIFGYKVFLSVDDFRKFYHSGRVREDVLDKIILQRKGEEKFDEWKQKLLFKRYDELYPRRIGQLRDRFIAHFDVDFDYLILPKLFRIVCSYLDQGISIWNFPVWQQGFLLSIKQMEESSLTSFFKTKRVKKMLLEGRFNIPYLLEILIGNEAYYEQYLFDQQFAHPGWSGMVSVLEDRPETLMDRKKISLNDLIAFELLLEIDEISARWGNNWSCMELKDAPLDLFADYTKTELHEIHGIWQEAFEWSYYDEVLAGLKSTRNQTHTVSSKSFQALFCIDDREISLRDYLERNDAHCETFGTPGFFNVEFYFQPENGKSYTKLCPAPITPKYLIKEIGTHAWENEKDIHFAKSTYSLFAGMIISPMLGLWTAVELALNIFKPSMSPATASSFKHMDRVSKLTIENESPELENGLQVGFTLDEMTNRVEGLLRSIGLVQNFAPIVYVVGHGASSVNNPFYATMDCGACSCRPGSVNARVLCFMANHPKVREKLAERGLVIPSETQFLGGLHDTTRDEIVFYDEATSLSSENMAKHAENVLVFEKALDLNSKERSRRFESIDTKQSAQEIHKQVKARSVSLFEPRPELDHANNCLTIVGSREMTKQLFLDRRSFLNSYDYKSDADGSLLFSVLKPIAPVCGGINLSYYFARVDNQKLGAGTKLPHNVMGLIGVANGIDGDLRPGLPSQMVEAHDPVRQMLIVEHFPEVVRDTLKKLPSYEFYFNNWMHVVALNPETGQMYFFERGDFVPYEPLKKEIETVADITRKLEESHSLGNIPVLHIN